jgi:hypothetical protein
MVIITGGRSLHYMLQTRLLARGAENFNMAVGDAHEGSPRDQRGGIPQAYRHSTLLAVIYRNH